MYGDESQTDRPVCLAETTQRTNHAAPIHVSKVAIFTPLYTAGHGGYTTYAVQRHTRAPPSPALHVLSVE